MSNLPAGEHLTDLREAPAGLELLLGAVSIGAAKAAEVIPALPAKLGLGAVSTATGALALYRMFNSGPSPEEVPLERLDSSGQL